MRAVIQRVNSASVEVDKKIISKINQGLLIFLGIHFSDSEKDLDWLVKKIVGLRIFSDENEKMNLSISDVDGEILIISQFTLFASTKKGNRPSFLLAAKPEKAIPLYQLFIDKMEKETSKKIATGIFGADMKILLENDGPVTIIIDSQNLE
ncbi:MAG: D-tyrosyl-tRNA(Tyr) deacylase [Bacteroidetes bacterium]|jgi:D-tyrosyl-tRNA(Tyr) deacylase|nr:D-tyrosyl-tRNA(Tyr) deacylase [Bacteroidota bacterium]MBP7255476.1 D-tyrosyl-tRNA(Tyr) deacylase [Chitinophagales bacterium]MBK7137823.1 D-tyrosyl-tRNA(Tyr) deacylase [Bacteroidota bacterium]MBK7504702.1 D-tyrosyl-tRNA(Tyr) deacylase [Bacteroidota bacterium]MBK7641035.1 D-tyrosyl-tRNA(Tyr) deacylase [Bacteroidota bacterium]